MTLIRAIRCWKCHRTLHFWDLGRRCRFKAFCKEAEVKRDG